MNILKDHPFWAIRLEVVRMFEIFDPNLISGPLLEKLIRDDNYLVRHEATQFAIKNFEVNKELLNEIVKDEKHPAKAIMLYIFSSEEVKAA